MKYKLHKTSHNDKEHILEEVLRNRGIKDVQQYLHLDKSVEIPYNKLDNIEKAVKCVLRHIEEGNKIGILVDTDVDGFCSASMLYSYLKRLKTQFCPPQLCFLLHNKPKAHGLDANDVSFPEDMKLLIIPDAGTNDTKECQTLNETGIDVVVLDHHIQDKENPYAIVVNNQSSENYLNKDLCGAGVVYKFLQALDDELWIENADDYLDLCALANISDSMDMKSLETRYLVNIGLKQIQNKFFTAIIKAQEFSMKGIINIHNVQYYITPYLNALIRIGEIEEQEVLFKAFIETDETFEYNKRKTKNNSAMTIQESVYDRAARFCKNAKARQDKSRTKAMETILQIIEEKKLNEHKIIIVDTTDLIDIGLTGVVAIRVAEHFNQPCLFLNKRTDKKIVEENGIQKEIECILYGGSGRNPNHSPIENLKELIDTSDSFNFAQGHPSAFGLSINEDKVQFAQQELDEKLKDIVYDTTYYVDFIYNKDKPIDITDVRLIDSLKDIYATGIDEVSVAVENIEVERKDCSVFGTNNDVISFVYNEVKYIQFKCIEDNEFLNWIKKQGGEDDIFELTVVGKPSVNEYNGIKTCQVTINDFIKINSTESPFDDDWGGATSFSCDDSLLDDEDDDW